MTRPEKQSLEERFADWVDGRLKPAERAALEAELARDPELRRAAEEYRRSVQVVRRALVVEDMEGSVADAVLARVARKPVWPPPAVRPYLASALAAAALVLVFVVVRAIPPAPEPPLETARAPRGETERFASERAENEDSLAGVRRLDEGDRVLLLKDSAAKTEAPPAGDTKAPAQEAAEKNLRVVEELGKVDEERAKVEAPAARIEGAPPADAQRPDAVEQKRKVAVEKPGLVDDFDRRAAGKKAIDDVQKKPVGELTPETDPWLQPGGSLGELALIVDVAAPADAKVWKEIDARSASASTSAAEVLALLAPPLEARMEEAGREYAAIDFRHVGVARASELQDLVPPLGADASDGSRDKGAQPAPSAAPTNLVGGTAGHRDQVAAKALPTLQLLPGDRVFRVTGSLAQLRAFSTTLQARVAADQGRFAFQRVQLPAGATRYGARTEVAEGREGAPRGVPGAPPATAGAGGGVAAPSTPSPAGPATQGPPARARADAESTRGAGGKPGEERVELLLVLRPGERGR